MPIKMSETNFYQDQKERYIKSTEEMRQASRKHWLACLNKNIEQNRNDLIIFAAQILAMYDLADAELNGGIK